MKCAWTVALLLIAGCSSSAEWAPPDGPSQANPLDSEENNLLYAVNVERMNVGVPSLTLCASLDVSASAHSDDMRDKGYLSDTAPDGTLVRDRACKAGYQPACDNTAGIAELVADGVATGAQVVPLWTKDQKTKDILLGPMLTVAGVGRALGGNVPLWSLDLGSKPHASCAGGQ